MMQPCSNDQVLLQRKKVANSLCADTQKIHGLSEDIHIR